jgi:hypothetical protein
MSRSRRGGSWWGVVAVVLTGAVLGWWMFSLRGAGLFAGIGLVAVGVFRLVGARAAGWAAALALLLAAAGLQSASTLGWAGADVPDGTRFKASPVGVSHVLTPHQLTSRTVDCGWYAASGYAAPCAVARGGAGAFRRLRLVYPLVLLAVALCVLGALLSLRPAWRLRTAQRLAAGAAALVALAAVSVFAGSVGNALAVLADLPVGVGGTLGTMQLAAAVLLCLATSLSPSARPTPSPAGT